MRPLWPPKTPTGAASVPSHCSPITNAASDLRESGEGNERQSNLCAKRCCVGDGGTGWGKVIYDRILGGMWVQKSKRAEKLAIKRPKSRKRHSAEVGMSRELHWEVTCSFPALFTLHGTMCKGDGIRTSWKQLTDARCLSCSKAVSSLDLWQMAALAMAQSDIVCILDLFSLWPIIGVPCFIRLESRRIAASPNDCQMQMKAAGLKIRRTSCYLT